MASSRISLLSHAPLITTVIPEGMPSHPYSCLSLCPRNCSLHYPLNCNLHTHQSVTVSIPHVIIIYLPVSRIQALTLPPWSHLDFENTPGHRTRNETNNNVNPPRICGSVVNATAAHSRHLFLLPLYPVLPRERVYPSSSISNMIPSH